MATKKATKKVEKKVKKDVKGKGAGKSVAKAVAEDEKKKSVKSVSESKVTLVTVDGLQKLKEELKYLEEVKRKEIADRIKEAVSYGDLSENSEYEEAKNEQAFLEGRIIQLTEQIKFARLIDEEEAHKQSKKEMSVQLGNVVKVKVLSGKLEGETYEFSIVGTTEADPMNQKISNESPVGAALLDQREGEKVTVKAPIGDVDYKILKIT